MNSITEDEIRIGIDLGGTKIELIALDHDGDELLRFRKPTPAGSYRQTIALIAEMVVEAEQQLLQRVVVGIGTPGSISLKTGMMKNCNSTCLNGKPLKEDIEAKLGREVRISNDASCFALSEAVDGAAAGADVAFGVILGTGVGGGLIVRGHVIEGANRIGGEWGHNPLPAPECDELPGPACYCGRTGCIESWLSGPAMAAEFQRQHGEVKSAAEIAKGAEEGCHHCVAALDRYCDRLAKSLAGVINVVDPDVVVLGGGLSNIGLIYELVPELWGQYIFSDAVRTRLLPAKYGDSSGVRGAAWLWNLGGKQ